MLTTPVIRACRARFPEAEIHFLTKPAYAELMTSNPYLNRVYTLHSKLPELADLLRKEGYDTILDLHNNLRTRRLAMLMGKYFERFNKINVHKWLKVNHLADILPQVHIVNRYLDAGKKLGLQDDQKGLDFFFAEADTNNEHALPKSFVCYAIGGQHQTKKMPNDLIVELCNRIERDVVLLGGKEDISSGDFIAQNTKNTINMCGRLSLAQSARLIQDAEQVITHDTGMMHIASAFQKRVLVLWGNTIPEFGMYPFRPHHDSINFEVNLGCRPCSKIGFSGCPNQHFHCMKRQDLVRIATAVNSFLDRKDQRSQDADTQN